MAVSTAYAPLVYNGNSSTTAFSVTFPFFTGTLLVTLVASTGVETAQTISTHYTVSGGTDSNGLPATGTVTMVTAPATGAQLRIERVTPKTQATSWANNDAFPAKSTEAAFDKLLLIAQEVSNNVNDEITGDTLQLNSAGATDYWDAEDTIIRNVLVPQDDDDAANKEYVDEQVALSAIGSANFTQAGSGAVERTWQAKMRESVSVLDYGVTGDGSTDDRANIVIADAAAAALGKILFFPKGTYNISAPITPAAQSHWKGENRFTTIIRTTSATTDILDLTNGFVTIEGLQFASTVTRSAGWFLDINAGNITVRDFYISAAFEGVRIGTSASIVRLQGGDIVNTVATTGISIRILGGLSVSFDDVVGTGSTAPFAHVYVSNCGDLSFDENCHFIGAAQNMVVAPSASATIASIDFRGWLDQATTYNLQFDLAAAGSVFRSEFSGAWITSAASANVVFSGASGAVNGVSFVDCELYDGTFGLSIDATTVSNIQIVGGRIADASSSGIYANNVAGLQVTGTKIGSTGNFGVNVTGINLAGTTDNVLVAACDLRNNTTVVTNTASGTNIRFKDNVGYDGVVSPSQITADQNNYAPTGHQAANTLRLNSDAARNITGIVAPGYAKRLTIHNVGSASNSIALVDESASSTAANRFALNGDCTIFGDESVEIEYDTTTSRWRLVAQNIGAVTAAGRSLLDDASAAAQATTLGLGTGDSPQFTAINLGHASDTTITRPAAGRLQVEGVEVLRTGVAAFSDLAGAIAISQMGSTTYAVGNINVRVASINFNSANTDTPFTITLPTGFTRYAINAIFISGASASLTTATCGVFTAAGAGGTAIVASGTAITVSTASEDTNNNTHSLTIVNANTNSWTAGTLYFRVQTAQGSAATASVTIRYSPIS